MAFLFSVSLCYLLCLSCFRSFIVIFVWPISVVTHRWIWWKFIGFDSFPLKTKSILDDISLNSIRIDLYIKLNPYKHETQTQHECLWGSHDGIIQTKMITQHKKKTNPKFNTNNIFCCMWMTSARLWLGKEEKRQIIEKEQNLFTNSKVTKPKCEHRWMKYSFFLKYEQSKHQRWFNRFMLTW